MFLYHGGTYDLYVLPIFFDTASVPVFAFPLWASLSILAPCASRSLWFRFQACDYAPWGSMVGIITIASSAVVTAVAVALTVWTVCHR